jgi:hypothetical protein
MALDKSAGSDSERRLTPIEELPVPKDLMPDFGSEALLQLAGADGDDAENADLAMIYLTQGET